MSIAPAQDLNFDAAPAPTIPYSKTTTKVNTELRIRLPKNDAAPALATI
jgi:hypothetical protein